jgi:phosphoglycerate dehydrogenase-like enzyme
MILLLGFNEDAFTPEQLARVRAEAGGMEVVLSRDKEKVTKLLDRLEVIVGSFPRELLPRATHLRWYQQWGAGADWLLAHPEAAELDFVLTNASGVHAVPMSEHIFAYLLAFARKLPQAIRDQERRRWTHADMGGGEGFFELADKTMLLLGVGAIGKRVAKLAQSFGMRVLGIKRHPENIPGIEVFASSALPSLLPAADAVVLTVPLTKETKGMIGKGELEAMKQSAYLINVGRGGTVVEADLIRALQEGRIAGAGLDVFETEPLPEDSPLWGLENVIITAHNSGLTPRYQERALEIFLENLRRYRRGGKLLNVVNKELGY